MIMRPTNQPTIVMPSKGVAWQWHRRTNLSTHPALTMPGMAGNV